MKSESRFDYSVSILYSTRDVLVLYSMLTPSSSQNVVPFEHYESDLVCGVRTISGRHHRQHNCRPRRRRRTRLSPTFTLPSTAISPSSSPGNLLAYSFLQPRSVTQTWRLPSSSSHAFSLQVYQWRVAAPPTAGEARTHCPLQFSPGAHQRDLRLFPYVALNNWVFGVCLSTPNRPFQTFCTQSIDFLTNSFPSPSDS